MKYGSLDFKFAADHHELLADPTFEAIVRLKLNHVHVAAINADLADTADFCAHYDIGLDISANCVVVKAKRAERIWYVALLVLATDRADINKTVKKYVDARKLSFAPMDEATSLTNMEYGGITPIGLPSDWALLIDERVLERKMVVIGSGIRGSKILVDPEVLRGLPNAEVLKLSI